MLSVIFLMWEGTLVLWDSDLIQFGSDIICWLLKISFVFFWPNLFVFMAIKSLVLSTKIAGFYRWPWTRQRPCPTSKLQCWPQRRRRPIVGDTKLQVWRQRRLHQTSQVRQRQLLFSRLKLAFWFCFTQLSRSLVIILIIFTSSVGLSDSEYA